MTKYHISASGEPALCKARLRACPLPGQHYADLADAQTHADEAKHLSAEFGLVPEAARRIIGALSTAELVEHRAALTKQGSGAARLNSGTMTFDELVANREALMTGAKLEAAVSVELEKHMPKEWQETRRNKVAAAVKPPRLNPGTMSFDELVANREALLAQAEADARASVEAEKKMPKEWRENRRASLKRWAEAERAKEIKAPGRATGWYAPELLVTPLEPSSAREAERTTAQESEPNGTSPLEAELQRGFARQRLESALRDLNVDLTDTLPVKQGNRLLDALTGVEQPTEADFHLVASQLMPTRDYFGEVSSEGALPQETVAVRLFDALGYGAAVPAAARERAA